MKKEEVIKQLVPGVIVGMILGTVVGTITGVNTTDEIPNIIGIVLGCVIPTLLNGTIILFGTSRVLERKLSFGKAVVKNIPYVLCSAVIGIVYAMILRTQVDLCTIPKLTNTIINAVLGVIVSTILGYIALKNFEKSVKYTRRDK